MLAGVRHALAIRSSPAGARPRALHSRLHVRDHRLERVRQRPPSAEAGCGWPARSPRGRPSCSTRDSRAPRCAPWLGRTTRRPGCAMSPGRESILFARNLFLPADLGGNRYPYETMRRLAGRGHRSPWSRPRLHGQIPCRSTRCARYRLYAVRARTRPSATVTNLVGATLALRTLATARRGDRRLVRCGLALGWAHVVPRRRWCSCFTPSFIRSGSSRGRWSARSARYMAAIERRVFALSARIVAVSAVFRPPDPVRAPSAADRVRVSQPVSTPRISRPPASKAAARARSACGQTSH